MKKQRPPIKRPYPAFVYVRWRGFNSMKDITIETRASAGGNVPDDTFDAELARMKAPRRRSAKQASLEHTWLRNKQFKRLMFILFLCCVFEQGSVSIQLQGCNTGMQFKKGIQPFS
eukprot:m.394815 g.394815  ORF g.394815 m.394815 type:complete len:116 (+) comp16767_c0_seq36:909-1256(+)